VFGVDDAFLYLIHVREADPDEQTRLMHWRACRQISERHFLRS